MELQKIKEIVLQGLKEAKELKVKAISALQEKADLEKNLHRFRSEAETLKRERGHFEDLLRKLKSRKSTSSPQVKRRARYHPKRARTGKNFFWPIV